MDGKLADFFATILHQIYNKMTIDGKDFSTFENDKF